MTADRFTKDVLREGLNAITEEMLVSLRRTSQSPIIYEVLDFGVGLSNAAGDLVSQGNGIVGLLGPLGDVISETIPRFPRLQAGDVIIANDPYSGGGTHLSGCRACPPGLRRRRADRVRRGQRLLDRCRREGPWLLDP